MLVDQDYPNVLPLRCKPLEGRLDGSVVRLGVYYEKVLLVVWGLGYMLGLDVRIQERIGGEL